MINRRSFLALPFVARSLWGANSKPNIFLILAGSWRAQSVPWAKDSDVNTPNLGRLGRESITFSRAYSSYPRMVPARSALLRGRFPGGLSAETSVASEIMRSAGYRVATFGSRDVDAIISYVHGASPFYAEWILDSPSGFLQRATPSNWTPRPNVPSEARDRAATAVADFSIRCAAKDQDIGVALAALDRPGLLENTIVVFTSDHGDQMGSHGLFRADAPFEESVRIPLAVRYPAFLTKPHDESILVSQIDILPTLLGMCGLSIPNQIQGQDLFTWVAEGRGERPEAVYAVGRTSQADEWRMLVHGYDKLVTGPKGEVTHLFNLADDPFELNNLAELSTEQLKRDSLLAIEQAWIRKMGDRVDASGLRTR